MKKSLGLLILGLLGLSLTSCISGEVYADADKYLAGDQTYDEYITSLDIDWVSGTLTLVEDETIEGVKIVEDTNLTRILVVSILLQTPREADIIRLDAIIIDLVQPYHVTATTVV